MTALTGLLDGATAEALKGLYGVDNSSEDAPAEAEETDSWSDYAGEEAEGDFCDNCGEEIPEPQLVVESKDGEILCGECDRRNHTHAVDRFVSSRSREKDFG